MKHNKIPLYIISGFLGSGKTTLLKRIIKEYSKHHKIAVIQNDFANTSTDAKELSDTKNTFELIEINNGSIFCVCLLNDFIKTLTNIAKSTKPEALFIETSGLSDPIAIGSLLNCAPLSNHYYLSNFCTVLSAPSFLKIVSSMPRIEHQVRVADTILINKTDIKNFDIEKTINKIVSLNPDAKIIKTTYCYINIEEELINSQNDQICNAILKKDEHIKVKSGKKPALNSVVLRQSGTFEFNKIENFIKNQSKNTYRIKGFVTTTDKGTLSIQSTFENVTFNPTESFHTNAIELAAIGPNLDADKFKNKFLNLCK